MNFAIFAGLIAVGIFLGGCGKKNSESASTPPAKATTDTASASNPNDTSPPPAPARAGVSMPTPVTQPILTAWQEGDKARAINLFVGSDWSARPVFPAGMALGLSEGQLKALPETDRALKDNEITAQLDLIKQLVQAVDQAGTDAVASGQVDNARRCFMSLKQFGAALDSPDRLEHLQILGKISKNMAVAGMFKLAKSAAANP